MTKKHLKQLEDIQYRLIKGINYLKQPEIEVCHSKHLDALSFYNKAGEGLQPMNKQIGSDLCYLYSALANITNIILAEKNIKIPQLETEY